MVRNLIAAFAAPALVLIAIGISAALASGVGGDMPAYGAALKKLDAGQAVANAKATFARADLDGSDALDVREYAALAIVTAELSRLNGFVALDVGEETQIVTLPVTAPMALTGGERARIEAVALNEFYALAGEDRLVSRDEFTRDKAGAFKAADRNGNGALSALELVSFAAHEARMAGRDV
jgi:hypothetical protein